MKMRDFAGPVAMGMLLLSAAWSRGQPAAPARPQFEVYWDAGGGAVMVTFTGGLDTPPTVATTGCGPGGADAGMVTFMVVTPWAPAAIP